MDNKLGNRHTMKHYIIFIFLIILSFNCFAEACTYNEAIAALQHNNQHRGLNLMRMAAKDGDERAILYLNTMNTKNKIALNQVHLAVQQDSTHTRYP